MYRLIIPGELPDFNNVIKQTQRHRFAYVVFKKKETERIMLTAKAAQLKAIKVPVAVTFHWYTPSRRKDPDNLAHGMKYIFDGLVKAGHLPDDTQHYVREIHLYFTLDRDRPRIEVELTPAEDQSS
jgi:Holliday junction resolvase RusA-like endonuclease